MTKLAEANVIGKSYRTRIILDIEWCDQFTARDPVNWSWHDLLDLAGEEEVFVVSSQTEPA